MEVVAMRPVSKTAQMLLDAANDAQAARIELAQLRYAIRFRAAMEADAIEASPEKVRVEGDRWIIEL